MKGTRWLVELLTRRGKPSFGFHQHKIGNQFVPEVWNLQHKSVNEPFWNIYSPTPVPYARSAMINKWSMLNIISLNVGQTRKQEKQCSYFCILSTDTSKALHCTITTDRMYETPGILILTCILEPIHRKRKQNKPTTKADVKAELHCLCSLLSKNRQRRLREA